MASIQRFEGAFAFLSNFYPSPVKWAGVEYPTVEHAYVAAKCRDPEFRKSVLAEVSPGRAKKLGRCVVLRKDWEEVKLDVMTKLVHRKFQDPELRKMLLSTGDAHLEEGNWWGDKFWGVCRGEGKNHLGRILMDLREDLRKEHG